MAVTVPAGCTVAAARAIRTLCPCRDPRHLIYDVAVVLGNVARQRPHMSVDERASYRRQSIVLSVSSSACAVALACSYMFACERTR
jgi:hypothetical protein